MKSSLLLLLLFLTLYGAERPLYTGTFDPDANGIFLSVDINGESCDFLFDTGASFVVLDKSYTPLLGKKLDIKEAEARTGLKFSETILTPNGRISLQMYKAIPLKLGRLQIANRFPYITADLQSLWPFSGKKFCGILGSAFVHQFRWEFDFEHSQVHAYIGAEPYMGEYAARTPIAWSRGHIPQIQVKLSETPLVFDIDLGDNGTGRMHPKNLQVLKERGEIIASHVQEVVTVSALSQSEEFRLRNLEVAGVSYPDLVMQTSKQNALGLAFFKRHNIVLDFPFHMLYLNHHKEYKRREEVDKSGIRLILQEGKVIVFSIKFMEGARVVNLQKGDEILSVEGLEPLSLHTLRQALRGKPGEVLHLKRRGKDGIGEGEIHLGKDPL